MRVEEAPEAPTCDMTTLRAGRAWAIAGDDMNLIALKVVALSMVHRFVI